MSSVLERELERGSGYSSPDLSEGEGRQGYRGVRALWVIVASLVLAVVAYASSSARGRPVMARATLNDEVMKSAFPSNAAPAMSAALAPAQLDPFGQVSTETVPAQIAPLGQLSSGAVQTRRHVRPTEKMDDGNLCDDSEEEFQDLCYTKCAILLGLPDASRVSAFSCCPTQSCDNVGGLFRIQTASLLPCEGFDVSSSDGVSCPHSEGACLKNEEQFMGMCYERCSLLSPDFPYRIAPMTCCNSQSLEMCLDPFNDNTDAELLAGGGQGDGDMSTPADAHAPVVEGVTEVAKAN